MSCLFGFNESFQQALHRRLVVGGPPLSCRLRVCSKTQNTMRKMASWGAHSHCRLGRVGNWGEDVGKPSPSLRVTDHIKGNSPSRQGRRPQYRGRCPKVLSAKDNSATIS